LARGGTTPRSRHLEELGFLEPTDRTGQKQKYHRGSTEILLGWKTQVTKDIVTLKDRGLRGQEWRAVAT